MIRTGTRISDFDRPIFGIIRALCDQTAKIQICMQETGSYMDYKSIIDVPHEYDKLKVYGIGLVDSEYKGDDAINIGKYAYAIEIRLIIYGNDNYIRMPVWQEMLIDFFSRQNEKSALFKRNTR